MIEWITANYTQVFAIIGGLVSVATIIVKLTPSQKDDAILEKIISILNHFSVIEKKPTQP